MTLEYRYNGIEWAIGWDPNKVINIREWSVCGGGQLERFYHTVFSYLHTVKQIVHVFSDL